MKIKKDSDGTFSLTGISSDDFSTMIQGCGIIEKRVFYDMVKIISDVEK